MCPIFDLNRSWYGYHVSHSDDNIPILITDMGQKCDTKPVNSNRIDGLKKMASHDLHSGKTKKRHLTLMIFFNPSIQKIDCEQWAQEN